MQEDRVERLVFGAWFNQHSDDAKFIGGVPVHKMRDHGGVLSMHCFFAGRVKVKLQKLQSSVADNQVASGRQVNLNRVAVVDNRRCRTGVVKLQLWQVGFDCFVNIDGALAFSAITSLKAGVKARPVASAIESGISPMGQMISHGAKADE